MAHPDQLLRRAVDGDLTPVEQALLDIHLVSCQRCRNLLAAQRQLDLGLRRLDRLAPPPDFTQRVQAEIGRLPAPRRTVFRQQVVALLLLLAGLLGLIATWDEFAAIATNVVGAASALTAWTATLGSADALDIGSPDVLGANANLALVFGLCLLGGACLMVLRQHTEA